MSHSPQRLTGSRSYDDGWRAVNLLIRSDGSWSGRERKVCYRNRGDGTFADVSFVTGLDSPADGRAWVTLDLDADGALDLVTKSRTGPQVSVFHNDLRDARESALIVELAGTKSNRDAVGARATALTSGGRRMIREVRSGSGFLSQSSRRLHFGVARGERIESLEVRWPSATVEQVRMPPRSGLFRLREGAARLEPLAPRGAPVDDVSAPAGARSHGTWLAEPVPAPELGLAEIDGKVHRLREHRGRKVLLSLWATWCPPCRTELADLAASARALEKAGVDVLAVSVDEPAARPQVAAMRLPFPVLVVDDRAVAAYTILKRHLFDRRTDLELPTSFLVDEQGSIVKIYRGATTAAAVLADAASGARPALPFPGRRFTPAPVRNYTELATAMAERGLTAEARVLFEAALGKGRTGPDLYNNFAGLLVAEGQLGRAEEMLRASLDRNPRQNEALANLGRVLLEQGRPDAALLSLEAAFRAVPDDGATRRALAATHSEIAIRHAEAGRHDEARAEFLRSVDVDPNDPASRVNLALFYARTGQPALALEETAKARSLDPDNTAASLLEAELLIEAGRTAEARTLLDRILARHPESNEARKLLERIQSNIRR